MMTDEERKRLGIKYYVDLYGQTMVTMHGFDTKEEAEEFVKMYEHSRWAFAVRRY
jgi:hypothetical protein